MEHSPQARGAGNVLSVSEPDKGTPPRMRGAAELAALPRGEGGNIPSDAGSIAATSCTSWPAREHSRGCGKQLTTSARSG